MRLTKPDSRRSHQLLLHTCRPATAALHISPPRPPPCARDAEVHRRHCCRRLPVLPHQVVQHHKQQPHGWTGCSGWATRCSGAWRGTGRQRFWSKSKRLQPWHTASWIRRRRTGWKPRTHSADHGGPWHGCRRVRRQHQARRVLSIDGQSQGHALQALSGHLGAWVRTQHWYIQFDPMAGMVVLYSIGTEECL